MMKGSVAAERQSQLGLALDAFIEMQTSHLHGLQAGRIGKLQVWLEQRQQTLARLRQCFAAAYEAGIDEVLRQDLLGKLTRILDCEEMIQGFAAHKKDVVGAKLARVRIGKKALGGYSQKAQGMMQQSPRFLSSKG